MKINEDRNGWQAMNDLVRSGDESTVVASKEVDALVSLSSENMDYTIKRSGRINVSFQESGLFLGSLNGDYGEKNTSIISTYGKKPFPQWRDKIDDISKTVTPPWVFGIIGSGSLVWCIVMLYFADYHDSTFPAFYWILSIILMIGGAVTSITTGLMCMDWWWVRWNFSAPQGSRFITKTAKNRLTKSLSSLTPESRHEYTQLIKATMKDYDSDVKLSVWLEQLAKILEVSPDYPASVVPLTLVNITEAKNKLVERAGKARALQLKEESSVKQLEENLREEFDAPLKDSALEFIDTIPLETLK